ncbi:hypothetical protein AVEN_121705-1 [Araneus ventricosus]|uniref:Uncharacterized protein n=1 Tax=Araneus ventricosus TaxID=182803 RepID=A0A4Y2T8B9_ARAVE|nr:hypothetical protein AVEN_121705-1 [Araneus ventricosus]
MFCPLRIIRRTTGLLKLLIYSGMGLEPRALLPKAENFSLGNHRPRSAQIMRKHLYDFMKITSKKFFEKLPQIPNVLLQLPPYDPVVPSSRKRPRTMLDYTYETFPTVKRRRDSSTIDANLDP